MDGNVLDADIAIVATGVRPNLDIVKDSGIEVLSGIIINEYLETNMPDVYAAEGITEAFVAPEFEKKLVFLWSNAIIQGTIAGYNMVGRKTKYTGSNLQTIIKVFGIPVVADSVYDGEELKLFENGVYKKMFIKDSKIIGYMLINTIENAGVYHSLLVSQRDISRYKKIILTDRFNVGMIIMEASLAESLL